MPTKHYITSLKFNQIKEPRSSPNTSSQRPPQTLLFSNASHRFPPDAVAVDDQRSDPSPRHALRRGTGERRYPLRHSPQRPAAHISSFCFAYLFDFFFVVFPVGVWSHKSFVLLGLCFFFSPRLLVVPHLEKIVFVCWLLLPLSEKKVFLWCWKRSVPWCASRENEKNAWWLTKKRSYSGVL